MMEGFGQPLSIHGSLLSNYTLLGRRGAEFEVCKLQGFKLSDLISGLRAL